jgi:hypothetical protein
MNRLPLSLPGRNAPDTPLSRLARALGTHPYAVALSALGWKPQPCAYKREDGDDLTWFIDTDVPRAHDLLARWEMPADSPKFLLRTEPDSPFAAAMCALENLVALTDWGITGQAPYFSTGGRFLKVAFGNGTSAFPQHLPVKAFMGFQHAAAIVTCGFVPWPELGAHGEHPLIAFAADSVTFPALRIDDIERACQPAGLHPRELPGYPAEEHPFFYALQAVLNLPGFLAAQTSAHRHPRVVIKSKNSPASVIASADLLREGRRDTAAFRDAVSRHLKKSS